MSLYENRCCDGKGHVKKKTDKERKPVQGLHFKSDGSRKGRTTKKWKEIVEQDMTGRGLHRMDARDCTRWRHDCRNRLATPTLAGKTCQVLGEERRRTLTLEQNGNDKIYIKYFTSYNNNKMTNSKNELATKRK